MVVAAMILLAAACRGQGGTRPRSLGPPPRASEPTSGLTPSDAAPSDAVPRYPNLSKFTDAFDRSVYKSAYSDCNLVGVENAADAYGGNPDDPASVARGYAAATFPQSVTRREAAFQGCLDAFETKEPG
jgi:hypothetical protein